MQLTLSAVVPAAPAVKGKLEWAGQDGLFVVS
jgi:hypothetical protein